jgi:hypothetical protein
MIRDHRKPQCASAHGANALLLAMSSAAFLGLNHAAARSIALVPVQLRCCPLPAPRLTLSAEDDGTDRFDSDGVCDSLARRP